MNHFNPTTPTYTHNPHLHPHPHPQPTPTSTSAEDCPCLEGQNTHPSTLAMPWHSSSGYNTCSSPQLCSATHRYPSTGQRNCKCVILWWSYLPDTELQYSQFIFQLYTRWQRISHKKIDLVIWTVKKHSSLDQ